VECDRRTADRVTRVGVDNMLYMKSTSGNDGKLQLSITFAVGTDPDIKHGERAERCEARRSPAAAGSARARHQRGEEVSAILQLVAFTSQTPEHDSSSSTTSPSTSSTAEAREGRGDVSLLTPTDYSMRIWLDPHGWPITR